MAVLQCKDIQGGRVLYMDVPHYNHQVQAGA